MPRRTPNLVVTSPDPLPPGRGGSNLSITQSFCSLGGNAPFSAHTAGGFTGRKDLYNYGQNLMIAVFLHVSFGSLSILDNFTNMISSDILKNKIYIKCEFTSKTEVSLLYHRFYSYYPLVPSR